MNGRLLPDAYSCQCSKKHLAALNTETCRKDIASQVSQFLASGSKTDVFGSPSRLPSSRFTGNVLSLCFCLEYHI